MECINPDAVPAGKRVAVSSQNLTDSDINTTCHDPGGMDPQASACTKPFISDSTGKQTVVRPRASTPLAAPRPSDRTHTDMTEARPTQPPIPASPDNRKLERVTELRRKKYYNNNKTGNLQ